MARDQSLVDASAAYTQQSRTDAEIFGLPPGYRNGFKPRWDDYKCYVSPGVANVGGTQVAVDEETLIGSEHWLIDRVASQWFYVYMNQTGEFQVDPLAPIRTVDHRDYQLYQPITGAMHLASIYLDSNRDIVFVGTTQKSEVLVAASTYDGDDADYKCDGENDERELLVAAGYLSSAFSGGVERMTAGVFVVDSALRITMSHIILVGSGQSVTTLRKSNAGNFNIIELVGTSGVPLEFCQLRDFTVEETGAVFANSNISVTYCNDLFVIRVESAGSRGEGIEFEAGASLRLSVDSCFIHDFRTTGIKGNSSQDTGSIVDCVISDNSDTAFGGVVSGINVAASDFLILDSFVNDLENGHASGSVKGIVSGGARCRIKRCQIDTITYTVSGADKSVGIDVTGNHVQVDLCTIQAVTSTSADGKAIWVQSGSDSSVRANTIVSGDIGIVTEAGASGTLITSNVSLATTPLEDNDTNSKVLGNSWEFDATTGDWTPGTDILDLTVTDSAVFNEDGNSTGDFRWESDNDTHGFFGDASADKAAFFLAGGTTITGKMDFAPDTDNFFLMGRAAIGYDGTNSDRAIFSHLDQRSVAGAAISHSSAGNLQLNAISTQALSFQLSGANYSQLNATRWDFNIGGLDHDFRVRGDNLTNLFATDASTDRVGVGIAAASMLGQFHVDQSSTTGAEPVAVLDQADVSEEFIRFIGTAASGVITQSIVDVNDVNTQTVAGFLRVYVQDDGNRITDQAYYLALWTLT